MTLRILHTPYAESDLKKDSSGTSPLEREFEKNYGKESFMSELASFIALYLDQSDCITVQTSGSTGAPKPMQARKEHMANSAKKTIAYLGLKEGQSALLCMPLKYIAGKMMVVRSIIAGLDIIPVTPCKNPYLELDEEICFSAITPMQAMCALSEGKSRQRMFRVKKTIIGGGAMPRELDEALQGAEGEFFSSYGMTETLSHIALRAVNGPGRSSALDLMPGVTVEKSPEGTLIIHAPDLGQDRLVTNDLVDFTDERHFTIRGRLDNVINSGGIKLHIEDIEKKLAQSIAGEFAVGYRKSAVYGQEAVLVLKRGQELGKSALQVLDRYEKPKQIIYLDEIPRTATHKVDRAELLRQIERQCGAGQ